MVTHLSDIITAQLLYDTVYSLRETGESLKGRFQGIKSAFLLIDQDYQVIYSSDEDDFEYPQVFENLETGKKNYIMTRNSEGASVYIAGKFKIEDESLYIVTKRNVTKLQRMVDNQSSTYRIITISTMVFCGLAMLIISYIMTRSIRKLNDTATVIAEGNYSARAVIRSNDEIGELGTKFNLMAEAVEDHVGQLVLEAKKQEEFVANFTHELKTPLTAVIGYSDMMRLRNMSEENRAIAADYIYQESMRLEKMSMKLFDLILLRKNEIAKKRLPMEEILFDVIRSVGPIFEAESLILKSDIVKGSIMGDEDILKSAFINLLDNARKASGENGSVMIKTQRSRGQYIVEIIDKGVGIPENELQRITEAFYMVDKSRTRKSGGAGLGLTLAAKIIDLHGGELIPISEVKKGTTMRVQFTEVPNEK